MPIPAGTFGVFPHGQLLPIGLEIPCSSYAIDVPLKVAVLGIVDLDLKGGIKFRIEANLGTGMGGVKLKIIGEEYSEGGSARAPQRIPWRRQPLSAQAAFCSDHTIPSCSSSLIRPASSAPAA
ncbi:hypothetical protein ACFVH0_16665 [Streptomyces sp. NPDC127117]|uniref:hypothetical protein n=1 Tax=Streptomyces sp. NPDC127117 TaxID=3345368 RepID=UPI003630F890